MELFILGAADSMTVAVGSSLVQLAGFLVLLGLLAKFAWGPIKNVMDERERLINAEIDDAEARSSEAKRLKEENDKILKETQADISSMMENAKAQAKKEQETIISDANSRANQLIQDAKVDIEREKQNAIQEINAQVSEISVLIAEKMIRKEINADDQKALIAEYLKEAGSK